MTDQLDRAIEAGEAALKASLLPNPAHWHDYAQAMACRRARAKAIIASILEPDKAETDFMATAPTAEATGYLRAIHAIRQRAGLEVKG